MNKYQLISDRKPEPSKENEIRITKNGFNGKYMSHAIKLLHEGKETILIKAMGQTIHKSIYVAEIIKRRIEGLHQLNELGSVKVVDVYEPIEEGLDKVEITKQIASICITLSTQQLDTGHPGYQAPLSAQIFAENNARQRTVRRDSRRNAKGHSESKNDERTESKGTRVHETGNGSMDNRQRGRGTRGRGTRGRGTRGRGGPPRGRGGNSNNARSGSDRRTANRPYRNNSQQKAPATD